MLPAETGFADGESLGTALVTGSPYGVSAETRRDVCVADFIFSLSAKAMILILGRGENLEDCKRNQRFELFYPKTYWLAQTARTRQRLHVQVHIAVDAELARRDLAGFLR